MARNYAIYDVFTGTALKGNPLAVVFDGEGLSDAAMQAIASEMNLSETVFCLPPENPTHTARLRIFTPATELPFAGHPTLGTAAVLGEAASRGQSHAGDHIVLRLPAGDIPVTRDHAGYWRLVAVPGKRRLQSSVTLGSALITQQFRFLLKLRVP